MRTGAHFGHGGSSRYQDSGNSGNGGNSGGVSGKQAFRYGAHGGGFGAASSKPPLDGEPGSAEGSAASQPQPPPRPPAPGDLTETALAAHNRCEQVAKEKAKVDTGTG